MRIVAWNFNLIIKIFQGFDMGVDKLNKIYQLFAPCIPVKGYSRSMIVDINRHKIHYIPNSLYEIIKNNTTKTLSQIVRKYGEEARPILLEYFNFLESNELIFSVEHFELIRFPKMSLHWDFYSICANAVLDICTNSRYNIHQTLQKLNDIHCFHIQIRIFKNLTDTHELESLIKFAHNLSFRSIQIIIRLIPNIADLYYSELVKKYIKLTKLEVFNAHENNVIQIYGLYNVVIFHKKALQNKSQCGCVDAQYFPVNMNHFTESQHFNTCLNRKIAIDENGEIKNCPSMEKSFGNIAKDSLIDILQNPEFKVLWKIRKDDIDVCKDCEHRYICTDCRCYIKNTNEIYSQPEKCTYNPYIAKWENEEGYIPVELWRIQNITWENKAKRMPLVKKTLRT